MLKSKITGAKVTTSVLEGEGSLVLDRELMKRADLWPFERVEVSSTENGARFSTTLVEAEAGSGIVKVTGPDAFLIKEGHRIVITAYVQLSEHELGHFRPRVIVL